MKSFAAVALMTVMAVAGGASAAMPRPAGVIAVASDDQVEQVQYRRGRPRCFTEISRIRFINRFGQPRVRIVERRVCR